MPRPSHDGRFWGRHSLTSHPDVTTRRHTGLHAAGSALTIPRRLATPTRSDSPRQPVLTVRASPSRLAAPSRSDLARQLQSSPSSHTPSPIYKPHVFMSLSLSRCILLDQNTTSHCTCNPVYYIKIIFDLGCFRPPAQPAHLYKSRFSVLACNNWQTLRGEVDKCVWEKHTEMHWRFDLRHDLIFFLMWNLPPG
jgi:hypothetical protein